MFLSAVGGIKIAVAIVRFKFLAQIAAEAGALKLIRIATLMSLLTIPFLMR